MTKKFEHLMLLGQPASGKSEVIDYVKNVSDNERLERFHLGKIEEVDDFLWIWEKFVEDDIWEKAGFPRKYSKEYMPGNAGMTPEGAPLLTFCIEKFNDTITNNYLNDNTFYNDHTLFIEYAGGDERSYNDSLNRFDPKILEKTAILFVLVTPDESWRRNVARYEEKQKHSILAHMVPKETFDHYYRKHDWLELTDNKESGYLTVNGVKVPFVTMNNEPELPPGPEIAKRYENALNSLFSLYDK